MVRHTIPARLSAQAIRAARTAEPATLSAAAFNAATKSQTAASPHASAPSVEQQSRSYHTSPPSHLSATAPASLAPTSPKSATVLRSRFPDNLDDVTLRYYVERRAKLDQSAERKPFIAGDLMPGLAASIRSVGLEASITPRKHKVPLEMQSEDGTVTHASGFVPPTPGQWHFDAGMVHDGFSAAEAGRVKDVDVWPNKAGFFAIEDKAALFAARALHTAARDRTGSLPMRAPVPRQSFTTATVRRARQRETDEEIALRFYVERKAEREQIAERKAVEGDLMPTLSANIISEGFDAAITAKEEKIPAEVVAEDGTVQHASGFVPPTPREVFEAAGVIAHGLEAHASASKPYDPAQDGSHFDGVPAESRGHREDVPAGRTKPRAPPMEPSQSPSASFDARV